MSYKEMTEIEKLRHIGRLSEEVRESLWDNMTRVEILRVLDAWMSSDWDFYPDQWTRAQLVDAKRYGISPDFRHTDESPITYEATDDDIDAIVEAYVMPMQQVAQ